MKIYNPLSVTEKKQDIKTVLREIAGQGGNDGCPYDQMQEAANYIERLETCIREVYNELVADVPFDKLQKEKDMTPIVNLLVQTLR